MLPITHQQFERKTAYLSGHFSLLQYKRHLSLFSMRSKENKNGSTYKHPCSPPVDCEASHCFERPAFDQNDAIEEYGVPMHVFSVQTI